jgi:multiple sugar transport system ATP-binding protein
MNIFRTRLHKTEDGFTMDFGKQSLAISDAAISRYPQIEQYLNQPILAGLRPEAFSVAESNINDLNGNLIQVEVSTLEALGHEMIVYGEVPIEKIEIEDSQSEASAGTQTSQEHRSMLTARVPSSRHIQVLQPLTLSVDTSNLYLFTSDGDRI